MVWLTEKKKEEKLSFRILYRLGPGQGPYIWKRKGTWEVIKSARKDKTFKPVLKFIYTP